MLDNKMNGAEAMVRMLEAHDVRHIFGLCGDTTLPFYDVLVRNEKRELGSTVLPASA